ncbi:hypothetical protein EJB05_05197, partial [Eragrostis curvula]
MAGCRVAIPASFQRSRLFAFQFLPLEATAPDPPKPRRRRGNSRMDPPPSGGVVDKSDFYHWLGCKILALPSNSTEGEFLLAVQVGDGRRLKELVSIMEEKDRAKVAEIHFDGTGLLNLAVFLGKIEVCRYFVEELGFDVDSSDMGGSAPLTCAALFGEVAVARYLLDRGANPNKADDTGSVPLHNAPNSFAKVPGTPLVTALHSTKHGVSESDALECVKLLVKAGSDVNSGNPSPPLAVATRNGLTNCVKFLLEAGANPNIPNNQDDTHIKLKDRKAELKKHGEEAALELDRFDATLYSNRSLCNLKTGKAQKALLDAELCIRIQPNWVKGYYRKGAALMSLEDYKKAYETFMDALELDPGNAEIKKAMWEAAAAM